MRRSVVLLALALLLLAVPAQAKRVALVIGVNAYSQITRLDNAVADAQAIAGLLKAQDFKVIERYDARRRTVNQAIDEFVAEARGAEVALFFFSGHGLEVEGQNFLLPSDYPADVSSARDAAEEAIMLQRVSDAVGQANARFSVMIIDACRNNPLPQRAGTRSVGRAGGLAAATPPEGLVMVFSAGVGQFAIDRLGPADPSPNGLFTRHLLAELPVPGRSFIDAVRAARVKVVRDAETVGLTQTPAIYDQMRGDFHLVAAPVPPPPAPPSAAVPAAAQPGAGVIGALSRLLGPPPAPAPAQSAPAPGAAPALDIASALERAPFLSPARREALVEGYPDANDYKALAIGQARQTYCYISGQPTAELARTRALACCQYGNREPCFVFAEGDVVRGSPVDGASPPQPIVFPARGSPFDPAAVPFLGTATQLEQMAAYRRSTRPKALALNSLGTLRWRTGETEDRAAEAALAACEAARDGSGSACFLFARGDAVVFTPPR